GEELLSLLDLSLSSLILPGDLDPARELCSRAWQVDPLLSNLIHDPHTSARRQKIAAAILGARGAVHLERLPDNLHDAWRAGRAVRREQLGALLALGPTSKNAAMLAALPATELSWVPRLLVRASALFGEDAGHWISREGLRLARKRAHDASRERALADRFIESLELLELLEREDIVDAWLPESIEALRDTTAREDHTLARCFRRFLQDHHQGADLMSTRALAHAAGKATDEALSSRAASMAEAWLARETNDASEQDTPENHKARCAVALHLHEAKLRIDDALSGAKLRTLYMTTRGLDTAQLRIVWKELEKHNTNKFNHLDDWFSNGAITWRPGELDAFMTRGHIWVVRELFEKHGEDAVHRYAEAFIALESAGLHETIPANERWFANLFATGKPWLPDYLLTLATASTRKASGEALAMQLLSLTRQASGSTSRFERHLEHWHTPVLKEPREDLDAIADRTGLSRETLTAYLHHRRIARGRERFSKQISALLDPGTSKNKTASQIAWLERELAREKLAPGRRDELTARLDALRGRDLDESDQNNARRARHQIQRALKILEAESLERTLDLYWSELLTARLGRVVRPEQLDNRIREISILLTNEEDIHDLFFQFLESVLEGRVLWDWPENRAWLERVSARNVDTKCWLEGFSSTVDIAGRQLQVSIEKDPIEALKMGTYFQTCLSLDGCHGEAALVDTVDVNKQVVYVRDEHGALVGRKLIGVNENLCLLGYETYARSNHNASLLQQAIDPLVRQFAKTCGLALADNGPAPRALHGHEHWYDDGTRAWVASLMSESQTTSGEGWWDIDQHSALEHAFIQARKEDDIAKLEQIACIGSDTLSALATRAILARDHERWRGASVERNRWDLPAPVAALLLCGAGIEAKRRIELTRAFYPADDPWEPIFYLMWAATTDDALQDAIIDTLSNIRARLFESGKTKQFPYFEVRQLTALLAAPLPRLLTFFDDLFAIHEHCLARDNTHDNPYTVDAATDLLTISWALSPDDALLASYIDPKSPPLLTRVLLKFLGKCKVEGASDRLLRRGNRPNKDALLDWIEAIGRQADPRARAELERLLEAHPEHERTLAQALARCGDRSKLTALEHNDLRALRRAAVRALDAHVSQGSGQEEPSELVEALDRIARIGSSRSAEVLADLCALCEAHARGFEPHHTYNLLFVHDISENRRNVLERFAQRPHPSLTAEEVEELGAYPAELESLRLLYLCCNLLRAPERETRLAAYHQFQSGTHMEGQILARIGEEFHATCEQEVVEKHLVGALNGSGFGYNIPANVERCLKWASYLEAPARLREALSGVTFREYDIDTLDMNVLLELAFCGEQERQKELARELFLALLLASDARAGFIALDLAWLFVEPSDEDGQRWLMTLLEARLDGVHIDTEAIARALCEASYQGGEIFSTRLALATLAHLEEHDPLNYNRLIDELERKQTQRSLGLARASKSQMRINPST
ncbi:MAG: hypothetical protein VYE40_08815, partial [Myxococcota bacterium]|nr:hypothetical protein [Myxococcota bacterium]